MKVFGCLSFFVIFKISFPNKYYYKIGGETKIDDDPNFKAEDKVDKVVIDLGGILYVASVKSSGGRTEVPKVYSYYVSVSAEKFECTHRKENEDWTCNRISALVIIEGNGIQGSYILIAEESSSAHFENYLGCFEAGKLGSTPVLDTVDHISDCKQSCIDDVFYGIGQDKCYCFKNTKELVYAKINLCSTTCKNDLFTLCGGTEYMSVYAKDGMLHKAYSIYQPSFECIYSQNDCPVCPSGRKGPRCKVINCQENKGDCGVMECDSFTINFALISACVCDGGYDENMTCSATGAFFTQEMMYIAIGLASLGLIGLLVGIILVVKGHGKSSKGSSSSS